MCKNGIVLRGKNEVDILWTRTHCRTYQCEECARANVNKHYARILRFMREHKDEQWYFETYTAHEKTRSFESSLLNLRRGIKRVLQEKRNKNKNKEHYFVKIFEYHRSGALHIHMLTNITLAKIDHQKSVGRLNDIARKAGMGYKANALLMNSAIGAAKYVTKYMIKSAHSEFPKGFRRVDYSRNFNVALKREKNDRDWLVYTKRDVTEIAYQLAEDAREYRLINARGQELTYEDIAQLLYEDCT